ncbi:ABC transporter ATP-binding protein [Xinfangfangia sp. CPCC 101601]|uniref:ABC transporter ATP-binding protein n=1 Tax=Pseudogemmobacter lacusdianii TaxID=3069608 RepID=A0ABU0W1J1_9RHOB|nr:ABC transporter ATP-binding protein [Xinfangfangia sp. CPCC 101601]MDQ2067895.1 ABC transporter ATP-binding protein [Xinfangfangia sp. CPCC 101601]
MTDDKPMNSPYLLQMKEIYKSFGPVTVSAGVTLEVKPGEIHALLGENGAGKSVLMSILCGILKPDSGSIHYKGAPLNIGSPREAIRHGIGMVHQHFMLVPNLTVAENYVLGQGTPLRLINDMKAVHQRITALSDRYGLDVRPDAVIEDLSVGEQQRVEILKVLFHGTDLLILDEPTAVLTPQETDRLLDLMRDLVADGKTVIFISHKLDEVMRVSDQISVMRDFKVVHTTAVTDTNPRELARLMVGRDVLMELPRGSANPGQVVLSVDGLSCRNDLGLPALKGVSFSVKAGEIVGIAGVSGNGQTELSLAISGLLPIDAGKVSLEGKDITGLSPAEINQLSFAHVPEDRHKMGVLLPFTLAENAILHRYNQSPFAKKGLLQRGVTASFARDLIKRFRVKTPDEEEFLANLSGGNQQKLVVARELARDPNFILVSQLTRGIDIGAIEFILQEMLKQRDAGRAILLISTELEELFTVCDRILVMFHGEILGEVPADRSRLEEVGLMMAGQRSAPAAAMEPALT